MESQDPKETMSRPSGLEGASEPKYLDSSTPHAEASTPLTVYWTTPEEQDPDNPMNWGNKKKSANILMIWIISFLV